MEAIPIPAYVFTATRSYSKSRPEPVAAKHIKVAHLTSVHSVSDARIFHKECVTLAGAGYEVVMVVPHSVEPISSGVRTRAVPVPTNRLQRMLKTVWQVFATGQSERAVVYHFHDPELIPAAFLFKLRGSRVIYDVHEDLPRQIMNKQWIPGKLRKPVARIAETFELFAARRFDGIVAATPAIARRFPGNKTITAHNFPVPEEFEPVIRIPAAQRPNWFAYVGGIDAIRGAREMVQAMDLLSPSSRARLILAGTFDPPSLLDQVQTLSGWHHVSYLGWQSRPEVARLLGTSRAGLVVLHEHPHFVESYPVKLFEYMAAGLPVIASDFPLWRNIIEAEGCGLLVNPRDPAAIARAILWILEHPQEAELMGHRGLNAVQTRYNWRHEGVKLTAFYQSLLADPSIRSAANALSECPPQID